MHFIFIFPLIFIGIFFSDLICFSAHWFLDNFVSIYITIYITIMQLINKTNYKNNLRFIFDLINFKT